MNRTVPFGSSVERISSMLNLSDVLTYLLAWQNGQTNFRILLSTGDGRFSFDCTLLGFSDTGIPFSFLGTPTPSTLIWLATISSSWTNPLQTHLVKKPQHTRSMCADSKRIAVPVKHCSFWRLQPPNKYRNLKRAGGLVGPKKVNRNSRLLYC
jgi:hypothetical protein